MGKPKKEINKNIDRRIFKHIQFAEDSLPNFNRRRNRKSPKTKTSLFCVSTIYGVHSWSDQVKYNKAEVFFV